MFFFAWKSRREYLRLSELLPGSGDETTSFRPVTAIIPARNEAANISRCVKSVRSQVTEVIVVDDGSADGTGKLAEAAGARVIAAPQLQPGYKGKPNACLAGARAASTPWLLFLDADTWYEPGFVSNLVWHAEAEKLTMVSVFLRNHVRSFWERVLVPYAFGLYFTGVSIEGVHSLKSREVLANGQCLLFDADAYEFTGGHRSVIKSVIEDVELARLGKRHRLRFEVLRAESLGHVRMYDSLSAIWRGFQKNSFQFLDANPGVGLQVIAASILATSWAPVLGWLVLEEQKIAALAFTVVPMLASLFWYRSALPAIFAPIAIYLFQVIAIHSMMAHYFGFSSVWKGRKV
jgi:glycosyltransferase involved in cell wall biosynthesis